MLISKAFCINRPHHKFDLINSIWREQNKIEEKLENVKHQQYEWQQRQWNRWLSPMVLVVMIACPSYWCIYLYWKSVSLIIDFLSVVIKWVVCWPLYAVRTRSFACSTLNVLFINIRNERFSFFFFFLVGSLVNAVYVHAVEVVYVVLHIVYSVRPSFKLYTDATSFKWLSTCAELIWCFQIIVYWPKNTKNFVICLLLVSEANFHIWSPRYLHRQRFKRAFSLLFICFIFNRDKCAAHVVHSEIHSVATACPFMRNTQNSA